MKHNNIAIFIPHLGCKFDCSFCNQRTISGTTASPKKEDIELLLSNAIKQIHDKSNTEIAFFGGSFTAIDQTYMLMLLETANRFVGENKFCGIRISTRPDAITQEILTLLKKYHVTSIELGAQSMNDAVLKANNRGHTADDVIQASKLIKENGFSLGLQMMVGLYKDSELGAIQTAEQIALLKPDTVRIYPTVILKNTKLASLYQSGEYQTMELKQAVTLCAKLLTIFEQHNIKVIKLGLHASLEIEKDMIGGIYHPAFKELCEAEIFYQNALQQIEKLGEKNVIIFVNQKNISKMIGQKKSNLILFSKLGIHARVVPNEELNHQQIIVKKDVQPCY